MERVDIIIPVYNTEKYLGRCLDSIIAQTYGCWRAICVDDGSTDASGAILDEYAGRDDRFKIIHTTNGGISRARNIAMSIADSEWLMFVDSDDLIHPQTLEIALYLAHRDNSDVVSWYRSRSYRWQIRLRRWFGMDTVDAIPWGYDKKYRLDRIHSVCTDDLASHCSELTHPGISMPVKHFYVWRHLFRREKIQDVRFIGGLKFEDFPWWSEVMLKNLRATVTNLFLYYRYPNLSSTVNTVKRGETVICFLKGLVYSCRLYSAYSDRHKMREWSRNCKWVVIIRQVVRQLRKINDPDQVAEIRSLLSRLWIAGAFKDGETTVEIAAREFIKEYIGSRPLPSSVTRLV